MLVNGRTDERTICHALCRIVFRYSFSGVFDILRGSAAVGTFAKRSRERGDGKINGVASGGRCEKVIIAGAHLEPFVVYENYAGAADSKRTYGQHLRAFVPTVSVGAVPMGFGEQNNNNSILISPFVGETTNARVRSRRFRIGLGIPRPHKRRNIGLHYNAF